MSARKDKRSRPFKRLLSDPWRKLASILLALLLWYYLNSLVTTPISSRLEVRLNTPGDGINVTLPGKDYRLVRIVDGETNEPLLLDEVVLRLEGPNDKISRLERQQSWGAQMTMLEVQSNPPQPPFITFQIDDLQHATEAAEFDPLLVSMTPRTVRLELSKNADEDVLLSMDNLDVKFGDSDIDRLDLEDPRFPTPSVTVFGSENLMRSIAVQRIFDVDLRDVSIEDEPTLTVALKLKPTFADQGIELDPEALFVEFKVNPPWSDIYDLEVPVVVDEQMLAEGDRGNFVPESAAVPVKIRIAGTLLQDLLAEQLIVDGSIVDDAGLRDWALAHARFRVYLRDSDLREEEFIHRRPNLELFKLDSNDIATPYKVNVDFQLEVRPAPIRIQRKDDGN